MATYFGTAASEIFLLFDHTEGDVIFGGGFSPTPNPSPGSDFILAGRGNDTIYGDYGSDAAFGGAGDDVIFGFGAAGPTPGAVDRLAGTDQGDYLDGGPGNDRIVAAGGDDIVFGGAGDDVQYGGSGADWIHAGPGDDTISSGAGADRLWGGAGRDLFVYGYSPTSNQYAHDAEDGTDTILDFTSGTDSIDLRGYAIREQALQVADTPCGLELHFRAVADPAQINLTGVHALQPGDIIFYV